ncbi:MAG: phosphohistidine phosphatase SixA, partial [Verrucomicrobia bacterium]
MPESIRLYLLHHAEAVRPDDPSAPLSPRGEAQVRALAAFLEKSGPPAVERVWHSPWAAPRETTDRLCDHLGIAATRREIAGLLPGAEVRGIARRLSGFGYPLMVVGHMPHLGRLVSVLV